MAKGPLARHAGTNFPPRRSAMIGESVSPILL